MIYGVPLSQILSSLAIPFLFLLTCTYLMGVFTPRNKFPVAGKSILLTGASEGLGLEVAKLLASKGASLFIVARNSQKLEKALGEIEAQRIKISQRFTTFSADVSLPKSAPEILSAFTKWNDENPPDIVWLLAGSSSPSLFLSTSPSTMRAQMDVNYWSCADLSHFLLQSWLSPSTLALRKPRHLIFTSSVVAFYSIAGYSPYSPSKAAIRSLADTLSQEILLYTDLIKVHTVFPGTVETPGYAAENEHKPNVTKVLEADDPVQSARAVAEKSIRGLERGEEYVVVNWLGQAMRAGMWGGTRRNWWGWDLALMGIVSLIWGWIRWDLEGKVRAEGKRLGVRVEGEGEEQSRL